MYIAPRAALQEESADYNGKSCNFKKKKDIKKKKKERKKVEEVEMLFLWRKLLPDIYIYIEEYSDAESGQQAVRNERIFKGNVSWYSEFNR